MRVLYMKKIQTLISRLAIGAIILLLAIGTIPTAQAQYAGTNGRILFSTPSGYATVRPDSSNFHILGTAVTGCYNRALVYNPAGTTIAYTGIASGNTDGDIFVRDSMFANTPQQLTNDINSNDCDPYYSPDGTRIAFARQSSVGSLYEVWVMNSDGTGQTQLTDSINSGSSLNPVWLDANTIYVENGSDIVEIDSSTANQNTGTVIYDGTTVGADAFDISPDGSFIVFANEAPTDGIYRCTLAATCTGATEIIADGAAGIDGPTNPAYSPDGTSLVFVGNSPAPSQGEGIFISNADGSGIAEMTFNNAGYITLAYTTFQPFWGTNNDTFTSTGDGDTTSTPGVPNTTATKATKNSPVPWMLGGLLTLMLVGLGGFWITKELKGRK